ncbi:hypothetical protein [Spirosoma endbachense]|uniref:Uncharacterized protein n=1 Tax=Spirosoma endbachense TaxID=2666025 RepID=A0A6P1VSZ2_9BACT|nr:hypothetical protein [Spirosoma endbachense]QHV95110.1 hypothetical protein GJR95_08785 [Spirosoma endbachense]
MKSLLIVVLFGGIICCSMTRVGLTVDNIHTTISRPVLTKYILTGTVTNATVNKTGSVEMELTEISDKTYRCSGKFDEKILFGRFDLYGRAFVDLNAPSALSIKFEGVLKFGNGDGSGFAPDTKAAFLTTLNIFSDNVTGSYLIGEIPNSSYSKLKQNGLYNLRIKSKVRLNPN